MRDDDLASLRLCERETLREGEREKGREGEWGILKLRITNYELRNGEFGEATGRQGDGENG